MSLVDFFIDVFTIDFSKEFGSFKGYLKNRTSLYFKPVTVFFTVPYRIIKKFLKK